MSKTEEERPDSRQEAPDAIETVTASEASVPAPEPVRYVYDSRLRALWASDDRPELAPGTLVELDLWGEGPATFYAQALAAWLLELATGLNDLGVTIERILAEIEQAEEEGRGPDDLVFWTAIIERLLGMSQSIMGVTAEPREADRVLLMALIDEGARELLRALKDQCLRHVKSVEGEMEIPKSTLRNAARLARDLGSEVDLATAAEDVETVLAQEIVWHPFTCDDEEAPTVNQGNNEEEVLGVIHFAASMRVDLGTLEIGFTGDGGAARAVRGVVR